MKLNLRCHYSSKPRYTALHKGKAVYLQAMYVDTHTRLRERTLAPYSLLSYMRKQCMCAHTYGLRRVSPHDPMMKILRTASYFHHSKNLLRNFLLSVPLLISNSKYFYEI